MKLILSGFLLLFFIGLIALFVFYNNNKEKDFLPKKVCLKDKCFSLEIANTPEKRTKGLMFRKELAEDKAMLFVFPKQGVYNFWMKNTLIPLDIIWVNQEGRIVFIKNNALPCEKDPCKSIKPNMLAKYVLEIKGGLAEKAGLEIGDKLSFNF